VAAVLIALLLVGVYALLLVASGAVYSSLIYGLQPWVQESQPFGAAFQQSLNLLGYRFWRNLLIWGLTALLIAAVGVTVTTTIGVILPLPLIFVGSALFGSVGALFDNTSSLGAAAVVIILLGIVGAYALLLVAGGAAYSSLIYALQPWVQEVRPFGEALQRSLELVTYRFWRNVLAWGLTALLLAAMGLTITTTIGSLLPLPLAFALGGESLVAQAIGVSAWVLGFVVVLPPLPIWMALLYRRNRAARDGSNLDAAVQGWWRERFDEPEPSDTMTK
jgi:hypothetical protein